MHEFISPGELGHIAIIAPGQQHLNTNKLRTVSGNPIILTIILIIQTSWAIECNGKMKTFVYDFTTIIRLSIIVINTLFSRHLKPVLHGQQTPEELLGLAEDGEEARGVPVNHDAEDEPLLLDADPLELVGDGDEALHLPEVARPHLLEGRTELQATLPVSEKDRGRTQSGA